MVNVTTARTWTRNRLNFQREGGMPEDMSRGATERGDRERKPMLPAHLLLPIYLPGHHNRVTVPFPENVRKGLLSRAWIRPCPPLASP